MKNSRWKSQAASGDVPAIRTTALIFIASQVEFAVESSTFLYAVRNRSKSSSSSFETINVNKWEKVGKEANETEWKRRK